MAHLSQENLKTWVTEAQLKARKGKLPQYIPLLKQADSQGFSLCLANAKTTLFSDGDLTLTFPLMSLIKPFLLFYLLVHLGEKATFQQVGQESSEYSFNSLEQLQKDRGFPRNPMINSGAIFLSSLLIGETVEKRYQNLRQWLNKVAHTQLFLDKTMLDSVQSKPNPNNKALVEEMVKVKLLEHPALTLNTYNAICCLSGTVIDVTKLGLLLLNQTRFENYGIMVQNIMLNCGLYEASQEFKQTIGFPTKSGVSGVILSLIPQENLSLACYSPPLDEQGNSVAGLYFIEKLAEKSRKV
ncbi:MAG: glutaminase [Microcystaceae cyanobacterium]